MIDITKNFYEKIISNLKSNNLFIKEKNKQYKYKDILQFYTNIDYIFQNISTKKKRICTLSKKTFNFYSSILSILISKNVWIPLDENLPEKIIAYMIKSSKADLILIDTINEKKYLHFLKKFNIKIINIDKISKTTKKKPKFYNYKPDELAMIFFTSGSTGLPKGVLISNINFISSLDGQIKHIYNNVKNERLNFADYHQNSFVISLNIILPCVFFKAQISPILHDYERLRILDHIKKNKINCLITLPSTINQIKLSFKKIFKHNMKIIVMCGEPFYYDVFSFIKNKIKPKYIFNAYGSTELSPWVFSYKIKAQDLKEIRKIGMVPIGKKFHNVKILIKNDLLYINGPMVNNYLKKTDNILNHKIISKKNWYLTNDRVKLIKKNVYVIGRSDSVVKIRGHRVELRGIESVIRRINGIKNCYVFLGQKKKIIAATESSHNNIEFSLKSVLTKNLQSYMRPSFIQNFKNFPKNKNGKIDRIKIKLKCKKLMLS